MNTNQKETFVERGVIYTIALEGRVVVIENVPARVCVETASAFFRRRLLNAFMKSSQGI